MSSFVNLEIKGRVATLTFNRPESHNAIGSMDHCRDIVSAVDKVAGNDQISCLIVTGEGKSFSAGGDLKSMKEKPRSGIGAQENPVLTRSQYRRGVQSVIRALWDLEIPSIAAVNGHAIGLGCDLACLCDIRIASEKAKFASSFINVGLIPGDGGAWVLPRTVGYSRAAEMIFTGETLTAEQALEAGLVSQVVAPDNLMEAANLLAGKISAKPALTLRLAKRLLREGQQTRLSDVLELSAAFQALTHETEDHAEAVDAFLEKRQPEFKGK